MKLLADIVPLDANPLLLIAAGVSIGLVGAFGQEPRMTLKRRR